MFSNFALTSKGFDGVLCFVSRVDLEARLLTEQADVNSGFVVPLT